MNVVAAKQRIQETIEKPDLTLAEKAADLGGSTKRFFRL
jgi:hypothetical protein